MGLYRSSPEATVRIPHPENDFGRSNSLDYSYSTIGGCDSGKEAVPSIRGAHPAGAFLAIESQRIKRQFFTPERLFKMLPQCAGAPVVVLLELRLQATRAEIAQIAMMAASIAIPSLFISLPLAKLEREVIQSEIDRIGRQ